MENLITYEEIVKLKGVKPRGDEIIVEVEGLNLGGDETYQRVGGKIPCSPIKCEDLSCPNKYIKVLDYIRRIYSHVLLAISICSSI